MPSRAQYSPAHLHDPAPPRAARLPLLDKSGAVVDHTWVDSADVDAFAAWKWRLVPGGARGNPAWYAGRRELVGGKSIFIWLHRELLGLPRMPGIHGDIVCDHINGDTLDNRRANLRAVTRAENARNRRRSPRFASAYPGVSWNQRHRRWYARGTGTGSHPHLGHFATEEEAIAVSREWRTSKGIALPQHLIPMPR